MPRFFISPDAVSDNTAVITGDDAYHISRSLRMRVGEELTLCDNAGKDYTCRIADITDTTVFLDVTDVTESESEPPYRVTVFQSLAKGDKFDTVIQKSVECGAFAITPLATSRCTVKLTIADADKKRVRWQKIASEGAKQCGRGIIPEVTELKSIKDAENIFADFDTVLFCYEKATKPLKAILEELEAMPKRIAVVIGPEGGFCEDEADLLEKAGALTVSLGKRILRTESAAPFILACLSYAFED